MMNMKIPAPYALRGDRPIESADEDRLGRAPFARAIAAQILDAPALESYVVAVMGPWGSGKTSMVNMIAEEATLRSDSAVVKFNPWIFSGAEQLVSFFFRELAAQFTELSSGKLSGVAASFRKYAGLFESAVKFVPNVGVAIASIVSVAKEASGALAEGPSLEQQRTKLRELLSKMDRRIIVLVDDIDRLRRDEIRELVKLVRLTGDFPNIVYVLAFDRRRVESALGDDAEGGRAYLEKIVQVAYDVPLPVEADLRKLLIDEISSATEGIPHAPFEEMDWNNILHDVILPLVRSARDVRRYANSLPATLRVIGEEIALPDVLALEAVRVFLPETFASLPRLVDALTSRRDGFGRDIASEAHKLAVVHLVEAAGDRQEVIRALISRLFPQGNRFLGGPHYSGDFSRAWHRKRRVADAEVLRYYLQRRLPEGVLPAAEVHAAFSLLHDRRRLSDMLDVLEPERLENLLGRLELYEDDFPPEHVEAAIGALLDQFGRLREGRQHAFDLGGEMALDRVVLRLLRRCMDEAEREAIVTRVLPTLRWLSAQWDLIILTQEHELAREPTIATWKSVLLERLMKASNGQLSDERSLGALLQQAIAAGGECAKRPLEALQDDPVLIRLLVSVTTESSKWSMGDVTSVNEARLPWTALQNLFGDGKLLEDRVREARSRVSRETVHLRGNEVLDLAIRYADGWRPTDRLGRSDDEEQAVRDHDEGVADGASIQAVATASKDRPPEDEDGSSNL